MKILVSLLKKCSNHIFYSQPGGASWSLIVICCAWLHTSPVIGSDCPSSKRVIAHEKPTFGEPSTFNGSC